VPATTPNPLASSFSTTRLPVRPVEPATKTVVVFFSSASGRCLVHGGGCPAAEEELSCGCRDGGRQVRARGDAADSAGHEFLGGVGVAVAN